MLHLIVPTENLDRLHESALSRDPVAGLTHQFYKYPARFSPKFAATAIDCFSKPGDLVMDPYMGGGTTILEAHVRGRRSVGCDINSLAVFVTQVKSTLLNRLETRAVERWANEVVPTFSYHASNDGLAEIICPVRTKNLSIPRAKPFKKILALGIASIDKLPTVEAQDFARCVLLNVGQWALNGRKNAPSLEEFRARITKKALEMLAGLTELEKSTEKLGATHSPKLIHGSAESLGSKLQRHKKTEVDLVVTSPPYPGVHMLYHRWQVDGRRESPAPYWITNRLDGEGASYYNFGGRHKPNLDSYFDASLRGLTEIRSVMRNGAVIVQMIAFSNPDSQVERYLENMVNAGFSEVRASSSDRMWRDVPGRSWHANYNGKTKSSREVVLVHVAI